MSTTPEDDITPCGNCYCMTHTINETCGKCGAQKTSMPPENFDTDTDIGIKPQELTPLRE